MTIENAVSRHEPGAEQRIADALESAPAEGGAETETAPREAVVDEPNAEARELVRKGRQLLERVEGDDAEDLEEALKDMEHALESGDRSRVENATPTLEDLVFYLEQA
jgi:hypothetical protein